MIKLDEEDVEWVVNDLFELGVKIGDQFFWLWKGESLEYEENYGKDFEPDDVPRRWRLVGKREFGETCRPVHFYVKDMPVPHAYSLESPQGNWQDLPLAKERERDWRGARLGDGQKIQIQVIRKGSFKSPDTTMFRYRFYIGENPDPLQFPIWSGWIDGQFDEPEPSGTNSELLDMAEEIVRRGEREE